MKREREEAREAARRAAAERAEEPLGVGDGTDQRARAVREKRERRWESGRRV